MRSIVEIRSILTAKGTRVESIVKDRLIRVQATFLVSITIGLQVVTAMMPTCLLLFSSWISVKIQSPSEWRELGCSNND